MLDCVVFGRVAGKHCAKYMLGNGVKETSLAKLSGEEGGSAPVAAAASKDTGSREMSKPGPAKDPTRRAYYKEEKWQSHPRGKTMAYWFKYQDKKKAKAEAKAKKEEEARALEEGRPSMISPWMERERDCLDMHYFPLPNEAGQNNLVPHFRQTRDYGHVQVMRWVREAWEAVSDTGKRKCAMISTMLMLTVVVTEVIKATPHE